MSNDLFYVWKGKETPIYELIPESNYPYEGPVPNAAGKQIGVLKNAGIFTRLGIPESTSKSLPSAYECLSGSINQVLVPLSGFFGDLGYVEEACVVAERTTVCCNSPYDHPGGGMALECKASASFGYEEILNPNLRPSFYQHIFDELARIHPIDGAYQFRTDNFAFFGSSYSADGTGNHYGIRVTEENVKVFDNLGNQIDTLQPGDWIWFNESSGAKTGSSHKNYIQALRISKGEDPFSQYTPLQKPIKFIYIESGLSVGKINFATMPDNLDNDSETCQCCGQEI